MPFEIRTQVGWAQLDANGHMANTAYLDVAVDCRMGYFQSMGFGPEEMARARLGPVVRKDEVEYFRELHLLQPIRVTLQLDGISEDASRFRLLNEVYGPADHLAARILTLGGWFDLDARRLVAPPQAMANALGALERSAHFAVLASSIK
ncbi:MAG TPA: thioesterase family protein [Usitatibacteraceae bacterium]|nr:thioesterase family protein [Usitatibacteraceae bacterium]